MVSSETAIKIEAAASALVQMATNEKLLLPARQEKHENLLHRAAESREFWQILHCASDKLHWRRDADTVGYEEITCQFVSPKSFSEQNVTQLF